MHNINFMQVVHTWMDGWYTYDIDLAPTNSVTHTATITHVCTLCILYKYMPYTVRRLT